MSNPTLAEIDTQFKNAIDILEEIRKFGHVNAKNLISMQDTLVQSVEGDFSGDLVGSVGGLRSSFSGIVSAGGKVLTPIIRTYGKFMGTPETDEAAILDALYQYFIDNSLTVKSREITFGTVTPDGGNVGNGQVVRLTKDRNNYKIENVHIETKTIVCTADQFSGATKHKETFQVRGQFEEIDNIFVSGSGVIGTVTAIMDDDSELRNPSFSNFDGTEAAPTEITDWTVGDISKVKLDSTNYFRAAQGDTTPEALVFSGNTYIEQLLSVNGVTADPKVPTFLAVAYNAAVSGANGLLTIELGSQTTSVNVSGASGWNYLVLAVSGSSTWFENWDETAANVKIILSGGTVFGLRIDGVILSKFTQIGGTWWAIPGKQTPFLRGDKFTVTDTATDVAKIQRHLVYLKDFYLPHTTGSPTLTDP